MTTTTSSLFKQLWPLSNNRAEREDSTSSNGDGKDRTAAVNGLVRQPSPSQQAKDSDKDKDKTHGAGKLLQILRALSCRNIRTLADVAQVGIKGEEVDDTTYLMERIIQLATDLPYQSVESETLTKLFLTQLWNDLDHPPKTSLGASYAARQPDGSHNSILFPSLGRAGQPYARSVRPVKEQPIARPDPGLIFDSLLARKGFTPHPNSISSVLFYIATIIIHDIFHTSHADPRISETSSYLDLAPLYGSSREEQLLVRTQRDGKLKADCFSDKRILGFPPGVGVLVIFYNRFHNSVVENLAKIDENARFSSILSRAARTGKTSAEAAEEYDEALFQTGRLVTTGLYINMILKDYVRTILNLNSVNSKWNLDPRSEEGKSLIKTKLPEGVGNQVSAEFNVIYRWHSTISQRDEAWTDATFKTMLKGRDPATLSTSVLLEALQKFFDSLPADPQQRPFHGIARQPDGTLPDEQLASIWIDGVEDVAGAFGAEHVPEVLRPVEILGIIQARSWNLASLNEFREYFNLTRHKTFADVNPDPYIQQQLHNLYGHVDNVELYPGVIVEAAKKSMSPGSGLCTNFTVSRAILSDAVSLVRSDRFYTLDYTPQNLTNWGYKIVQYDTSIDYGCVMHKVVLNALPNHFATNSIYAHYPLVTPTRNQTLLNKLGQEHYYDLGKPDPRGRLVRRAIVAEKDKVVLTTTLWSARLVGLGGPPAAAASSQTTLRAAFFGSLAANHAHWKPALEAFFLRQVRQLWQQGQYSISTFGQIDIIRDVVNRAYTNFLIEAAGFSDHDLAKIGGDSSFDGIDLFKLLAELYDIGFTARAARFTPDGGRRRQTQRLAVLITRKVRWHVHAKKEPAKESGDSKYLETEGRRAWKTAAASSGSSSSDDDVRDLAWHQILAEFSLTVVAASRFSAQLIDKLLSSSGGVAAAAAAAGGTAAQGAQSATALAELINQLTAESAQLTIASDASSSSSTTAQEQTLVYNLTGADLSSSAVAAGVDSVKIAVDLHEALSSALLQHIGSLADVGFGRAAGLQGQLKQAKGAAGYGEEQGILYLGDRQNELSNAPTALKVQWSNRGK